MPEQITIRPLTEDDWQAFSELRLAALKECPGFFGKSYEEEKNNTQVSWQEWFEQEGKCIFGIFDYEKLMGIQGIATYNMDSTAGMIWGSYISPQYRGHSYSPILYKACVDWGIKYLPWKKIVVSHREDNEASKKANQKFGFVFTYRESKTWPDGKTIDQLWYELELNKLRNTRTP